MSLFLRLNDLGAFMTIDEWSWRQRSIAFRSALREHKLASTYQSEHPGVVDMWIGSGAEILASQLGPVDTGGYEGGQGTPGLPCGRGASSPRSLGWAFWGCTC
jgi:hypothetical protein